MINIGRCLVGALAIADNIAAMRHAIEAAGVELIDEEGEAVGIRYKRTPRQVDAA